MLCIPLLKLEYLVSISFERFIKKMKLTPIVLKYQDGESKAYTMQDGFLFRNNKLYVPKSPLPESLVKEVHGGGPAGHFGINKKLDML